MIEYNIRESTKYIMIANKLSFLKPEKITITAFMIIWEDEHKN